MFILGIKINTFCLKGKHLLNIEVIEKKSIFAQRTDNERERERGRADDLFKLLKL